jgi:phage gp36-like protein
MAYATVQDALDRYGSDYVITSCDRDGDASLDTSALEQALDDATDFIDSFLIGRYTLPLLSTPAAFKKFCCDIAIFFVSENAGTMTNEKRDRYKRAEEWMCAVSEGKRRLVDAGTAASGPNKTQSATIIPQIEQKDERTCGSRRWTRDQESKL